MNAERGHKNSTKIKALQNSKAAIKEGSAKQSPRKVIIIVTLRYGPGT